MLKHKLSFLSFLAILSFKILKMFLKTKDLAKILGVSEATIKNWSREGLLKFHKTIGGHRRFPIEEIVKFIKDNKIIDLAGFSNADVNTLTYIIFEDYEELSKELLNYMLNKSQKEVENLLKIILFSFGVIKAFDLIVSKSLSELGLLSEKGEISVDQEHIASSKIIESIINLKNLFEAKKKKKIKLVITSLEGDIHEIPLRIIDFILTYEGYNVIYVGANTPYADIIKTIEREKPNFLIISAVYIIDKRKFEKSIEILDKSCKEINCILFIGGPMYGKKPNLNRKIYTSYKELLKDIKNQLYKRRKRK
jgi:excisionase family DNA binding protein